LIRISSKPRPPFFARALALIATLGLLCFAPPRARSQQPEWPPQEPLKVSTELVTLDATVLDKRGNFVTGLDQKRFRILDDGAEQPVVFFAPLEAPAHIFVLVETSPAVYLIQDEHLLAAYALLAGLAPDDQVALASYDESPRTLLGFTPDKAALLSALGKLQYMVGMGQLNYYDSLSAVLDWLAPVPGKRAIVAITTGLDTSPPARWDALTQKLRRDDTVIYTVAIGGWLRAPPERKTRLPKNAPKSDVETAKASPASGHAAMWEKADDGLRQIAAMTGGRAYFAGSPKEFSSLYCEIASVLRHEYVLGISPQHDGQFHSLKVEVLDSKGQSLSPRKGTPEYRAFARPGYLAPPP
jgi:Ca-activated chloride channel homolog